MNYGRIIERDIANGKGVRVSIFVSGCRNHCEKCFQPETWDFNYGKHFTDETIDYIIELLSKPYISGLTILGGEPMEPENQSELLRLVRKVKSTYPNKNIWCYTGYTLEQLLDRRYNCSCEDTNEFISYIDVLVDGRFVNELRDITLKFCGSSNQRVINLNKTREENRIVLEI